MLLALALTAILAVLVLAEALGSLVLSYAALGACLAIIVLSGARMLVSRRRIRRSAETEEAAASEEGVSSAGGDEVLPDADTADGSLTAALPDVARTMPDGEEEVKELGAPASGPSLIISKNSGDARPFTRTAELDQVVAVRHAEPPAGWARLEVGMRRPSAPARSGSHERPSVGDAQPVTVGRRSNGSGPSASPNGRRTERRSVPPLGHAHDSTSAFATRKVFVVPGRRRFHGSGCLMTKGHEIEELSYAEALAEGFSACTTCGGTDNASRNRP